MSEVISVDIVDDRGPVFINLKDAVTQQDILKSQHSISSIRNFIKGQDQRIKDTERPGGPEVLVEFDLIENDITRIQS